jgi:hypothetical protein
MVTTFAWVDRYGTDYPVTVAKNVKDRSCALLLIFWTVCVQHRLHSATVFGEDAVAGTSRYS